MSGTRMVWTLSALGLVGSAYGNIDLELRPEQAIISPCNILDVGVYAVSDDEGDQYLSVIEMVFSWDPAVMQLVGLDDAGTVDLLGISFPPFDPFHLNEAVPPQDGDGLFQALANPIIGPPPATPEGSLVGTLQFQLLGPDPAAEVVIERSGGKPVGFTIVYGVDAPLQNVTGTLLNAHVQIVVSADLNQDGLVGPADLAQLLGAWGPNPGNPADLNGDGGIDGTDLAQLLGSWGPCP